MNKNSLNEAVDLNHVRERLNNWMDRGRAWNYKSASDEKLDAGIKIAAEMTKAKKTGFFTDAKSILDDLLIERWVRARIGYRGFWNKLFSWKLTQNQNQQSFDFTCDQYINGIDPIITIGKFIINKEYLNLPAWKALATALNKDDFDRLVLEFFARPSANQSPVHFYECFYDFYDLTGRFSDLYIQNFANELGKAILLILFAVQCLDKATGEHYELKIENIRWGHLDCSLINTDDSTDPLGDVDFVFNLGWTKNKVFIETNTGSDAYNVRDLYNIILNAAKAQRK